MYVNSYRDKATLHTCILLRTLSRTRVFGCGLLRLLIGQILTFTQCDKTLSLIQFVKCNLFTYVLTVIGP